MIIDTDNKRIMILNRVKRLDKKEVFFQIPGHEHYTLSSYGRVHKQMETKAWHVIPLIQNGLIDYYEIDGKMYTVLSLIKQVFFAGIDVNLKKAEGQYPYQLENIIVNESSEKNELLLFTENGINEWLDSKYLGIWNRSMNPGYKARNPQHKDTTISDDWRMNPNHCKQYLLDMSYYYPEPLDVDKDLISFGTVNEYREGNILLLPKYINIAITRRYSKFGYGIQQKILDNGDFRYYHSYPVDIHANTQKSITCADYLECLEFARQKRFEHIHDIVEFEWQQGYLPEYILELLEELADGTKSGKIKLREPDDETLKKMGVAS